MEASWKRPAADHYQAPKNATAAQKLRQYLETRAYMKKIHENCIKGLGV
jgi:hypothetical protein